MGAVAKMTVINKRHVFFINLITFILSSGTL